MSTRCGYISLIGRPNAGKSSLMNSLMGTKLVGVSQKPNTTRNRILGIDTLENSQALFLDTPGLHSQFSGYRLNQLMNDEAWAAMHDADVICYVIDGSKGWHAEDATILEKVRPHLGVKPVLVLMNKVDKEKKHLVEERLNTIRTQVQAIDPKLSVMMMSAKRPELVRSLREKLHTLLPEGPFLFDPEQLTDRPQKFVVAELIRERLFRLLGEELPYQTGVVVEKYEDKPGTVVVYATIIVGRDSQKGIVIGRGGDMIKRIGMESREQIELHCEKKVFLDLAVKVDKEWFDRDDKISAYADLEQAPKT